MGEAFSADIGGSVGFAEGLLMHFWHGTMRARLYHQELDVLHDFDPARDLTLNPQTRP